MRYKIPQMDAMGREKTFEQPACFQLTLSSFSCVVEKLLAWISEYTSDLSSAQN